MMTSTTAVDRRPRFPLLKKSAAILFWIAVWEIVSLCVGQELLVPSPAQVLVRLLQLLRETDESVAEIARAVGYESQSKFTAAFKEYFGALPKEYRKNH